MTTNAITVGSLAAIANRDGLSLAESFLNCDVLVLIDQSGSMSTQDVPHVSRVNRTPWCSRFEAADNELARLQREHPGKVGVISFSSTVEFNPGGVPNHSGGSTDMAAALDFARIADGVCKIVLISDGEPDSQSAALAAARRFKNAIHTVYIGSNDDNDGGRAFLARLAAATGGRTFESAAPGLLADGVERLLLAA